MSAAEILPVAPLKDRVLLRFEPTGDNGAAVKEELRGAPQGRFVPNIEPAAAEQTAVAEPAAAAEPAATAANGSGSERALAMGAVLA